MKKWREPYEFNLILGGILLFMRNVQLKTTVVALQVPIDLTFMICLSICSLFILPLSIDRTEIYSNPALLAFMA